MPLRTPVRPALAAPARVTDTLAHAAVTAVVALTALGLAQTPAAHAVTLRSAAAPLPATSAPAAAAVAAAPLPRYLPTGTGMWIYQYQQTVGGNAARIVEQAEAAGLSTLFVRTGSSWDGLTPNALGDLLAATRGTSIALVAWDFPNLANPVADAQRLAHAAWYRRHTPDGPIVRAVAPDIETPAEGTADTRARVALYLSTLRRLLPPNVSILSTVPWPSQYRVGSYPYHLVAHYSDALLPMDYWYTTNPGYVTTRTVQYLRRFNRPIMPVGQGYNSQADDPWLPPSRPVPELHKFLLAADHTGVRGISLWDWQTSGPAQWNALLDARHLFPAPPVAPARPATASPAAPRPVASKGEHASGPAPARRSLPGGLGVRSLWRPAGSH